jgi:VRR-NUC domain
MKEVTIEQRLKAEIEKRGGMCVKFPPLFFAGFPDRIVLLPNELIAFVELKAPGKEPSPIQRKVHARLRKFGFLVFVIDSLGAVDTFLELMDITQELL